MGTVILYVPSVTSIRGALTCIGKSEWTFIGCDKKCMDGDRGSTILRDRKLSVSGQSYSQVSGIQEVVAVMTVVAKNDGVG